MDTLNINKVLNSDRYTRAIFGGTWSLDCFPKAKALPICYVINTSPSWHPGTHWVVVYKGKDRDEYFCSYGSEPSNEIQRILRKDYTSNRYLLQSPTSDLCGQYCILYLLCKCRGYSLRKFENCFSSNSNFNDQLVSTVYGNYISRHK